MRLQAERQQSESTYERGVRHSPRLMEPIVGSAVEPRLRHDDTHNRPAEEPRLDHDRLDEPDLPVDRSRRRDRRLHHPRTLERLRPSRERTGATNVSLHKGVGRIRVVVGAYYQCHCAPRPSPVRRRRSRVMTIEEFIGSRVLRAVDDLRGIFQFRSRRARTLFPFMYIFVLASL